VKVGAVRVQELPEIDDEWAQSLSEEIGSVDELRKKIRADVETQSKDEAEGKMRSGLLRQLVDAHEVELPEKLLAHQTEHRFESVVRDMVNHGIDPSNAELNWDKARENLRQQAGFELRSSLLLEALADAEKLEVSDQDIDDEINAIADASKQTPEQVRAVLTKQGGESSIASRLRNRKALDLLVANAKVTDEDWKEEKQESEPSSQETE